MRVSHRCTYVCWKYRVKSRFLHVEAGPKEASCRQASVILAVTVTVFRKSVRGEVDHTMNIVVILPLYTRITAQG